MSADLHAGAANQMYSTSSDVACCERPFQGLGHTRVACKEADEGKQLEDAGAVQVDFPAGGSSLTSHGAFVAGKHVFLCASTMKWRAALADYFFWWAHRLHGYALNESGSYSDYLVAQMCAVSALAEITELAAALMHELGHMFGNSFHCRDSAMSAAEAAAAAAAGGLFLGPMGAIAAGWLAAKNPSSGNYQHCCQYVVEDVFRARVMAKLGLPTSWNTSWNQGSTLGGTARFENYGGTDSDGNNAAGRCKKYRVGPFATVYLDDYLELDGRASVQLGVGESCSNPSNRTALLEFT